MINNEIIKIASNTSYVGLKNNYTYKSSKKNSMCGDLIKIELIVKKLKIADKPSDSTWPAFYAVSILTGIGFTMSLFVGNLAFANNMEYMDGVKIGVLAGSLLSTLFGYFLLLLFSKK